MNSGLEKKLSMDELLEKNRPAQMVQTTPQLPAQELTTPPEVHPMKAEWEELLSSLCTLGYHTERQTGYLKKVNELLAQLPTRTQMDELLKAVRHLEQMSEQAGKRNEKYFSLSGIRLPRLSLPDIPWISLLLGLAALALTGLVLWGGVVQLGHTLERGQGPAPVKDATTTRYHADSKALRKERQKKIALGHKEDDHEEEPTWQQTM